MYTRDRGGRRCGALAAAAPPPTALGGRGTARGTTRGTDCGLVEEERAQRRVAVAQAVDEGGEGDKGGAHPRRGRGGSMRGGCTARRPRPWRCVSSKQ